MNFHANKTGIQTDKGRTLYLDMELEKKAVLKLFDSEFFKTLIKQPLLHASKSSDFSETIRKEGNELFVRNQHNSWIHEQVLRLYTASIAAADKDSEQLALAYGNRSALLLHLKKYEASVQDIDRGLKITTNNSFKIKLLCRKVKCLNALGSSENKKAMKAAESLLKRIEEKDSKKILEDLVLKTRATFINLKKPKLLPNNEILQSFNTLYKKHKVNDFSTIEIKVNEKYGRYLVCNKDLKPGDVIYIEKPYTQILSHKKIHAYCSHCFCETWSNIPCDQCSWVMFCSEKCKKSAWDKYHKYECSIYSCFEQKDRNDSKLKFAIRCLFLAIAEAGGIQRLKTELQKFDECKDYKKGYMKGKKIQSLGFKTVYNLTKDVKADELSNHKVITARVLKSMTKNSNFFFGAGFDHGKSKRFKNNENALFFGSLILRLSKIAQVNCNQIWNSNYYCVNNSDKATCWKNECCSKGVYVALVSSLLNHSCNPNVKKVYTNDHHIIVYAVQPINKGSQLFDCYGLEYHEMNLSRKKNLIKNYNFTCDCISCIEKWPRFPNLVYCENILNFSNKQLDVLFQIQDEFEKILYTSIKEINLEFNEKHIAQFGKALETIIKNFNHPTVMLTKLVTCLNLAFEKLYGIKFTVPEECNFDL